MIGILAKRRRGLPGNLVEEYRAGIIATASPFTGFQPILRGGPLSIATGSEQTYIDKAMHMAYLYNELGVASSLLGFSGIRQTT